MTENLSLALQLLIVGMTTVFMILGIVVGLGRSLIFLINKYSPEPPKNQFKKSFQTKEVADEHVAVLAAIVDLVTDNRGVITKIQKL